MKRSVLAPWDGAILVGGRSRRMGRNKALLQVDGVPLWRRQVRVLQAAGAARVSLVLRKGQRALPWSGTQVRDGAVDAGPLAGLVAGLGQCRSAWLLAVAVDLGKLNPGVLQQLFRECRPGRGAVFCGRHGFEPLAAFYPVEALPELERTLRSTRRALQPVIRRLVRQGLLVEVAIPTGVEGSLSNWNQPEDLPALSR